jgi:hypothetical protein
MNAPESERLSEEMPWPGMRPYSEDDINFFFGREAETADLLARVERSRLTLLYAQAGLGKTSLIRAGLIPEVSKREYLPIYLRPRALLEDGEEPISKIISEIKIAVKGKGIDTIGSFEAHSLWELFHRESFALWDASNRIVIPVLIFDQFEELFQVLEEPRTITRNVKVLLHNLADLVENRLPQRLRGLELPDTDEFRFNMKVTDYRVLFSFREDYLPHVRQLRNILPSVIENHLRLEPLTGHQALDIIWKTGERLIERDAAMSLVQEVGKRSGILEVLSSKDEEAFGHADNGLGELIVEPALLSVVCFYQNEERKRRKLEKIDSWLIQQKKAQDIFAEYYRLAFSEIDFRTRPKTRHFIESTLVTTSRQRVLYPVSALKGSEVVASTSIDKLIAKGILRKEWFGGEEQLELSHDLLIAPIQDSRQQRKRRRYVGLGSVILLALSLGLFWSWYDQSQKAQQNFLVKANVLVGVLSVAFSDEAQRDKIANLSWSLQDAKTPLKVNSLGQAILNEVKLITDTDPQRTRSLIMFAIMALQSKIDLIGEGGGELKTLISHLHSETQKLCKARYVVPIDEIVTWFDRNGTRELPCK